jgi:CreA protein
MLLGNDTELLSTLGRKASYQRYRSGVILLNQSLGCMAPQPAGQRPFAWGFSMRIVILGFVTAAAAITSMAHAQTRIAAIGTQFRWLGPNDKIVVERYDDPKVPNVSCYMSRAETGGVKGGLGLAEDPSRFSIACRAVGPIEIPAALPKSEVIGFASASLFFKTFRIYRAVDKEKKVLVYTVVSTKLINGSPFNSISVVPAFAP